VLPKLRNITYDAPSLGGVKFIYIPIGLTEETRENPKPVRPLALGLMVKLYL
jgi:hypothetical protein